MAKPSHAYYEHFKRQHRVFGAFLALHCWHNGYDALLIDRETLSRFFELKKFTEEHLSWLRKDIEPFFRHSHSLYFKIPPSKFGSVVLSRVPIPTGFVEQTLTDEKRTAQWRKQNFRVAVLSELKTTKTLFTECDAASFLALVASGLAVPERIALEASLEAQAICRGNLKDIQGAKEDWRRMEGKTANASPTDSDLFGNEAILIEKPQCPAGGTYSLGRLGEAPRCSVPGHTL
ncbi:MAG: hypothetical protein HZA90_20555 [Verrucomicrobia bacterium]|nr:hypothetical protein [Verrucomicrobiota bacterium]